MHHLPEALLESRRKTGGRLLAEAAASFDPRI